MRFRLADMWAMQILMQMRVVSPAFGGETLLAMLVSFEEAAALYEQRAAAGATAELLPLSAYIGRYEDPSLSLRRAAQDRAGARFHAPYLPASRREGETAN
jgi:hypothetical protein